MTVLVQPAALWQGDFLADDSGVYVVEVWTDVDGTWVEWSDGECGYMSSAVRVYREVS